MWFDLLTVGISLLTIRNSSPETQEKPPPAVAIYNNHSSNDNQGNVIGFPRQGGRAVAEIFGGAERYGWSGPPDGLIAFARGKQPTTGPKGSIPDVPSHTLILLSF